MHRRSLRSVLGLSAVVAVLGAAQESSAQNIPDTNGPGIDTHLFRPAMDSKGFFTVNGTDILGANDISLGLVLDYGNTLLRVQDQGQDSSKLITHSFQGTFHFNYGIANWLIVGLSAPVNLMTGNEQISPGTNAPIFPQSGPNAWSTAELNSQTLGYLALHSKFRILRVERGFGLAVGVQVGLPVTDAPRNAGADPGVWYWPQLMAEKRFFSTGKLRIGLNAGYRGHSKDGTTLALREGQFRDGNRFTYSGAIAYRVADPLDLVAETYGTYLLSDSDAPVKMSNEVVGGIKLFVERNSYLMLGAGPRYTKGFEAADVRAFLGFIFEPSIGDRDGDGYKDDVDKCPNEPEDFDGFQDEDGCPEGSDGDRDGDGILDSRDKCPDDPEDRDGFEDQDGCPDPDNDKDGIPDKQDACPNDPEDKDGFEDADGCPDPDNDKDQIPDVVDKCPNQPETYNGFEDEDGCPDKGSVVIQDNNIMILEKIKFKTGSAEILPESNKILDAVATTIVHHPEFVLMEVAGHADERSDDKYNLRLTQDRVNSVMAALIRRGVERNRLRSKGYGEYCPEDPAHNAEAWETNRRVEFKIVKTKDGPTGVELGCSGAAAKGVRPDPIP